MKCYLCANESHSPVDGTVRDNPSIKILRCNQCGLVFLSSHDHVKEEFYQDNLMERSVSDIDSTLIDASDYADTSRRFKEHALAMAGKRVLDFGCGRGSFLSRLKRERITDRLSALELNKKYHRPLSGDFVLFKSLDEFGPEKFDFITMFHVMEHLSDPLDVLNKLYDALSVGGRLIIEVPSADDALLSLYDCEEFKRFTYWSCHLFLFQKDTLELLLKKTPFKITCIKQIQRYSLANHLHWLSKGKPGGHVAWQFLDDEMLNKNYADALASTGQTDTIVAVVEKA